MATDTVLLNSGFKMPLVLFGTWQVRENQVLICLDVALGCGYRGIDTAAAYGNETLIGAALNGSLYEKYKLKRQDLFITSKLAPKDHGYDSTIAACKSSLASLKTPYLDLYLIHWPGSTGAHDNEKYAANRKASWEAMVHLQKIGLVKSIGVSNYLQHHLEELFTYSDVKPAVNQIEHHPLLNQANLVEFCKSHGIHYQAYSSLGTTSHHEMLMSNEVVKSVAKNTNKSIGQVLLKWSVQQGISVLPKSLNPLHIQENIDLFSWELSPEDMSSLSSLNQSHHFCWNPETVP